MQAPPAGTSPSVAEITLPRLTGTQATVQHWYKQPGATVEVGDPLVLVTTDRVAVDLPATAAGQLRSIEVDPGASVATGQLLATIAGGETTSPDGVSPPTGTRPQRLLITPLARKVATVHGYDLGQIVGTGRGGRIVGADVLRQFAPPPAVGTERERGTVVAGSDARENLEVVSAPVVEPVAQPVARPRSTQQIAASLVPVAVSAVDVDLSNVEHVITRARGLRWPVVLTPAICFAYAAAQALLSTPVAGARWSEDGLVIDRTIAVAINSGAEQTLIRDAAAVSLTGIARQASSRETGRPALLIRTANSAWSEALLGPDGVPVLTVGTGQLQPVVKSTENGDEIVTRVSSRVTLCYDARVLTAVVADTFLIAVKARVEQLD